MWSLNRVTSEAFVHEGVRYPCDQCDALPFTQSGHLKRHEASVHEGVRFVCDECDASPFYRAGDLKKHKASAHSGIEYPCDQCDDSFTQAGHLKKHKSSSHKRGKHKSGRKDNLNQHVEKRHVTNETTITQMESIYPQVYNTSRTEDGWKNLTFN